MLFENSSIRPEGKPSVSVIIPTLNESKNLPLVLPYIPMDVVDEVILVDGRSKDDTAEIARQLLPSIKVFLEKTPGKGAALRRGYAESTGDILIVLDADGSHDPREIPRYVQALLEGADFAKGSRFAPTGGTTDMPRLRKYGNWGLTKLVNVLFAQSFTDLCYGYHGFWRHCLEYMDLSTVDGFEIDTAIYLQAVRRKLKVVDVPSFEGFRFYGQGNLRTFPDGWRVLRTILREWQIALDHPAPEPQIGFRSYNLRSIPNRQVVPVTGQAPVDGAVDSKQSATPLQAPERRTCSLQEFFEGCLNKIPQEDSELVLSAVLLEVMERTGASSGSLVVMDDELQYNQGFQVFGRTPASIPVEQMNENLNEGITSWVIQNQQPVLIENTMEDPLWLSKAWERQSGVCRSAITVPFLRGEQVCSVITLTRPVERCFTQQEMQSLPNMVIYF